MEYLWCFFAALSAGIGTGLAGLSAATVMVPIMIVLCPSFAGESGAYHATAIALASDILGSAFTSAIYIRHKNIDLKRSRIMIICIIAMCIAGSLAAWYVGNVVLGTFSLFLCVGIGIRFLVKPDTEKDKTAQNGDALDWKGVVISLFFGLTIGFGTGFVGSGGGMMMLVVFTAFLGMNRKTAVGTSTLIMTFTALIAFVSHSVIDVSILLERWDILLICIVTESAASIISARFANRVNSRTVGLVTGSVLTILGVIMLGVHYREPISRCTIFMQILSCFAKYLIYLAICVSLLLIFRKIFSVQREIWRKCLHFVAFTSSVFIVYASADWLTASLCCLIFAAAVFPILNAAEKWKGYEQLFNQRRKGEVKFSLLLLFVTHAVLIGICGGLLDRMYIAVCAILVWGFGDMAAAIVGKRFGKHKIRLPLADPNKTWEGSTAMTVVCFSVGTAALCITSPLSVSACVVSAAVCAPIAAYVELITRNGNDTLTVPVANAVCLGIMSFLLL